MGAREIPGSGLEVDRARLDRVRLVEDPPADLGPGQVLLRVDRFGLTANNVTYAAFGDALGYWSFFPAAGEWGRVPAWGFADVVASTHDGLGEGARVFGYVPMATHLAVSPDRVDGRGFVDASPHRASLPPTYNAYRRVEADPVYDRRFEDQQMVLFPLFATSFLLDDVVADGSGSDAVVLSSASSKTAIGAAHLLARRGGIEVVGLTSPHHVAFVEGLGVYDRVLAYGDLDALGGGTAVFVDLAGNAEVRAGVHRRYGDRLRRSLLVGATHRDATPDAADLPGPQPTFFFAPDHIRDRIGAWGRDGFDARLGQAWHDFAAASTAWLAVTHDHGPEAAERAWLDLIAGHADPAVGHVLTMHPA